MNKRNIAPTAPTQVIDKLLNCGLPFALFRVPGNAPTLYLQCDTAVQRLSHEDKFLHGFLYAPFEETEETPTILLRPDMIALGWDEMEATLAKLSPVAPINLDVLPHKEAEQDDAPYEARFSRCMAAIQEGKFCKLVPSKCQQATGQDHLRGHEAHIFLRALDAYPGNMVHLLCTPITGLWIGSSPELLLGRQAGLWQTMALAGTQTRGAGAWSDKNVEEQNYVARFIHDLIRTLGAKVENESAPHTLTTGHLEHRCTDFRFRLPSPEMGMLHLARALHPTPAVGGYPQKEAYAWLRKHEQLQRNYFAGYLGPVKPEEESMLYVNLRCAQVTERATYYYAGGGLTQDSVLTDEQREIERKMDTLKNLNR